MSIPSTTSHSQRRRVPSSARPPSAYSHPSTAYQPFPSADSLSSTPRLPDHAPDSLLRAHPHNASSLFSSRDRTSSYSARSTDRGSRARGPGSWETASESGMSGMSVLSAFPDAGAKVRRKKARKETEARRLLEREEDERRREARDEGDPTGSLLRRWAKWMLANGQEGDRRRTWLVALAAVVLVRWCAGLGGYSGALRLPLLRSVSLVRSHPCSPKGYATPPLRGDFEAQRHWLSLTSSSLSSRTHLSLPFVPLRVPLYHPPSPPSSSTPVPTSSWYSHDLSYWGLDYPPLTAYHSFLLGLLARLSPSSARFITLRPDSRIASEEEVAAWEANMSALEGEGDMRNWMRASVIVGDVLLWGPTDDRSMGCEQLVAALTILFQPALILIDNGHFQYNSIMLALTLWAINAFQAGHDLLGSILFVCSLGFKQMALYYAPGVFAYLFGKCLWLGGRDGLNLFLHLGLTVALAFTALFLPFLTPFPHTLLQALERIFPFSRGLFEDKVANAWCALNVVVKLRELASVPVLARLALGATALAVLPSTAGVVYLSRKLRREKQKENGKAEDQDPSRRPISLEPSSSGPAPTSHLLPHLLFLSSLSFFLFSFQVHEKSILLPLMPLTLLMGGREAGYGRMDWEWGVLVNNVAVFSMYPLLKRDGLQTHYLALTLLWNFLIGYDPLSLRPGSFVKLLSLASYALILLLHALEALTDPPAHLPDLFAVLNLTLSAGVFGVSWLWASKRLGQEGWALGGLGLGGP
ncbi:SPOSA6832_03810 [Sporobolomyces salmonicolor]|uniref:Alpha-1,3-glucosyltransferase n=1 Tax=Sporidiobolus salmonicolor TaxID=5005 RepID=A0A0D6EQB9_SPOSA|nr:SPOSA6832_03810 [Sporobolomyces salmonicolor]